MNRARAVILAGGMGTRLRPLTDTVPKCLVPVGGRPLVDYWVDALARAGVREALINTHHLPDRVREHLAHVNAAGRLTIREAFEPVLLGSAGTIHANRGFVPPGGEALVIYADNLSTVDLGAVLRYHRSHGDPLTMVLFRSPTPEKCGIADLDAHGRITAFTEKPERPASNLANAGVYAATAAAYHEMADLNAFDLGFDVLPAFVGRMRGFVHEGYHRDIGTPESLAEAQRDAPGLFRNLCGAEAR